jgi:dolichol-phosphate mannosyltransferase
MIWLFLPAYNEADSLPSLLPKIAETLSGHPYRIVVVDDGSRDRTPNILDEFRGKLPLDVVTHSINRGLGETERDGFEFIALRCAPEDVVVRVEADDTHEPRYIFSLLEKLESGYDVVNTSRFQPGGGQMGVDGYRAVISRAANLFMQFVFGIPGTRDYSCGFRAYRAQIIKDAIAVFGNHFIQLRGLGFTSTLEMIVKLHLLGARFAEVPFVLRYDQKQGGSKMVSSITTLGYLLMAVLYHWPLGGWRSQYQQLGKLYRTDRSQALDRFGLDAIRRRTVSRISF